MSFSAFIVYTCAGPHSQLRIPPRPATRERPRATRPPTCRPRAARREPRADPRRRPASAAPGARFVFRLSIFAAFDVCTPRRAARIRIWGIALRRLIDASDVRCAAPAPAGPAGTRDRMRSAAKAGTPNRPLLRRSHAHAHASNRRLTCRLHATATDTHAQAPRPAGP